MTAIFGAKRRAATTGSACAELTASLGYRRYVTHGSEQASEQALELAQLDAAHLAGIHVTRCLSSSERGGSIPALQRPDLLERSLLDFFAHFR